MNRRTRHASGEEVFDLDEIGRIFVFGAGKGIQRVAKAIEDVLGDRLTGGHVIDKQGGEKILERIEVTFGAHPVPDEACVRGCERILEMTADLTEDDLVFTMVGNGVSSLLTLPAPGISLAELQRLTYIFQIERGGPTIDLIPIRNHLDQMKGGRILPPSTAGQGHPPAGLSPRPLSETFDRSALPLAAHAARHDDRRRRHPRPQEVGRLG